jgi:hypothetical protein
MGMPIPNLFDSSISKSILKDLINTGRLIDEGQTIDNDILKRFSDIFYGQ